MSRPAFAANRFFAVTPSDSSDLTDPQTGVVVGGYIKVTGTAGNVRVLDGGGIERTYPAAAGELIQCYVTKVFSTSTTATGLWCFAEI